MRRVVCSVFDSATGLHGQPIFAPALGAVQRSFMDEVSRGGADNPLGAHPEDYTLYYIADFYDDEGIFTHPEGGVRVLMRGKDVVARGSDKEA